MKKSFMLLLICVFAYADSKIEALYQAGDYVKACEYGANSWRTSEKDEKFMMTFGNACVKADYIDYLSVPAVRLGKTKQTREASALYATLLTEKRLLLMALVDGVDISGLALPQVAHILSLAFDKMSAKELELKNGVWVDKNGLFSVSVIDSPSDKSMKTLLITETNGSKRIMLK